MANIYYPKNSRILQRETVSSSFTEEVIGVLPNVVFLFGSGSQLEWISSSVFSLTSSWAQNVISASQATSASWAPSVPSNSSVSSSWASSSISASWAPSTPSSISISASFASSSISSSYSLTASYALNVSNYTPPAFVTYSLSASWASSSLTASYALSIPPTSSYANNALSASWAPTVSVNNVASASWASSSISSSYALNAENADTASYFGSGSNNYIPYWTNNTLTSQTSFYTDGTSLAIGTTDLTSYPRAALTIDEGLNRHIALKNSNPGGIPWSITSTDDTNLATGSRLIFNANNEQSNLSVLTLWSSSFGRRIGVNNTHPNATFDVSGDISASGYYQSDTSKVSFIGTSSWALDALSASWALASINSDYAISASWVSQSLSASYVSAAFYATYAINADTASLTLGTASYAISASWAPSIPSDIANSSSWASASISSSYSTTASYALNGGGSSISTGSLYPVTSSWAITASYAISASNYSVPSFIKFDASEFIPRTTNGCGITSAETTNNAVNRDLLTFDPGLSEYAQAWFNWPAGWNTLNIALCWYATAASGTAVFFASVRIFNHSDPTDSVISGSDVDGSGTLLGIAAGSSGANRENFSYVAGGSFNPQGTKTAGNRAVLQIYRMGSHGSDTLSTDALLDGVYLFKVT